MFSLSLKKRYLPGVETFGFLIFAVPVALAVIASLWLTATAAYENVKFVRSTDQILSFVVMAREDASTDPNFAQQPEENLLDEFIQRGQIPVTPNSAWGGSVRVVAHPAPLMRIEAEIPARACRRLAFFFFKEAGDLKLLAMEAREGDSLWRQFFNGASSVPSLGSTAVDAACGQGTHSTLALTFQLR